jgi:hypothetical protein
MVPGGDENSKLVDAERDTGGGEDTDAMRPSTKRAVSSIKAETSPVVEHPLA